MAANQATAVAGKEANHKLEEYIEKYAPTCLLAILESLIISTW
jgi:hypothetical protein